MNYPHDIYTSYYFLGKGGPEQAAFDAGMLRYGDQLAAIAYAFGWKSFEDYRDYFRFEGEGMIPEPVKPAYSQLLAIGDACLDPTKHQVTRNPGRVLEVGGGRGEVSIGLSWFTHNEVTLLEPCKSAQEILDITSKKLDIKAPVRLLNRTLGEWCISSDTSQFDTLIFVESIEHIPQEEFDFAWPCLRNILRHNRGRLIITNWLSYHPMQIAQGASDREHCRLVDDAFYDQLASEAASTFYRNKSHLVLDF